jgi:hypothetical protein
MTNDKVGATYHGDPEFDRSVEEEHPEGWAAFNPERMATLPNTQQVHADEAAWREEHPQEGRPPGDIGGFGAIRREEEDFVTATDHTQKKLAPKFGEMRTDQPSPNFDEVIAGPRKSKGYEEFIPHVGPPQEGDMVTDSPIGKTYYRNGEPIFSLPPDLKPEQSLGVRIAGWVLGVFFVVGVLAPVAAWIWKLLVF